MIIGKNIGLRLYNSEQDVLTRISSFNKLDERSIFDHTEIYSPIKLLKLYNENGLWTKESGSLLLTLKDKTIIGIIDFSKKTEFEISIGYRILEERYRNKGYMTEALNLFTSYLFTTIPLITRLSLYTAEDNKSSRRLAEKSGFKQEGILRDAYFYRGNICNWVIYSLLRNEC